LKSIRFILLVLVLQIPGTDAAAERFRHSDANPVMVQDKWLARDKAQHLMASFILTGTMMYRFHQYEGWTASNSRIAGAGVTFGLGILKEWRDLYKPAPFDRFSWKDLIADLAGICLGVFFLEWW